jgi:23S rRNA pseudouridine1911/1915/1917 synthase
VAAAIAVAAEPQGIPTARGSGTPSEEHTLTLAVAANDVPARLDQFLAAPLGSRAHAQRLIDAGSVRVDGRVRSKHYHVKPGERIDALLEGRPSAEADEPQAPFAVAYEDEYLLVVDKPPGVVVHPARGHRTGTLAQALAGRGAGGDQPWRAGIVHRLDRDTSGLLVVAKRDHVHRALKALLAARRLRREYLALVEGRPSARSGTVDAPIGRHRRDRRLMSIDTAEAREARTHFELERALPASSLLRVVLDTGRTHQIRVHLAAIGHPVCGDRQYGTAGMYGLERQFLHAARLAFQHPVSGDELDISSPLPKDLAAALVRAERNA